MLRNAVFNDNDELLGVERGADEYSDSKQLDLGPDMIEHRLYDIDSVSEFSGSNQLSDISDLSELDDYFVSNDYLFALSLSDIDLYHSY